MSYGLYVFTPEVTLDKVTLSVEMLNREWRIVYISPDAFDGTNHITFLPDHGLLNQDALVVGWKSADRRANSLESIVADRNWTDFEEIATQGPGMAMCPLHVLPYNFEEEYDQDEAAEYLDGYPEDLRAARLAARWQYDLTTSAGRSPLALELQRQCWLAIAKTTSGLADDPQEGEEFIGEPKPELTLLQRFWLKLITPKI